MNSRISPTLVWFRQDLRLAGLPDTVLHEPWTASDDMLRQAKVGLEYTYPAPIVDHHETRQGGLQALADRKQIKDVT